MVWRRFEKMHPAPAWATDARKKVLKKRARAAGRTGDTDSEEEESDDDKSADEDEVDDLFRTTGGAKKAPKRGLLKAGGIDIDRVRDANQAEATSVSRVLGLRSEVSELTVVLNAVKRRLCRIPPSSSSPLLRHR